MRRRTDSLDAVARVRRVREQDSLAGLRQAMREVDEAQRRDAALEAQLAVRPVTEQDASRFVAARANLLAVGQASSAARAALASAHSLAQIAQAHWRHDKGRLKAIEMLQERRADEARGEDMRAEAKELDEVATQLWQRRRSREVVS